MNHGAVVLIACLGRPTSFTAAKDGLKNRALEIRVRLDDETAVEHPVRTADGARPV